MRLCKGPTYRCLERGARVNSFVLGLGVGFGIIAGIGAVGIVLFLVVLVGGWAADKLLT
jgi:hypothetical protein